MCLKKFTYFLCTFRAIIYYLFTTVCAVILGIILVVSIRPGVNVNYTGETKDTIKRVVTTADTLMDLLRLV